MTPSSICLFLLRMEIDIYLRTYASTYVLKQSVKQYYQIFQHPPKIQKSYYSDFSTSHKKSENPIIQIFQHAQKYEHTDFRIFGNVVKKSKNTDFRIFCNVVKKSDNQSFQIF